jgi:protein SCO1
MWTIFSCIGIMALILGLFVNRMTIDKELSIEDFKDLGLYLISPNRELEGFILVDSNESTFLPDQFLGQWNILFFGFTFCPDICPITMKMLSGIEEDLIGGHEGKFKIFMISVDPKRDSPNKLKEYLANFSKNITGLTGDLDQIYTLATQVNAPFMPVADTADPFYTVDHSGSIVIISPNAGYAGFFRSPHNKDNITTAMRAIFKQ